MSGATGDPQRTIVGVSAPEQQPDHNLEIARASILAEIEASSAQVAPTLRPLTLNTQFPLSHISVELAAKLEARVDAGFTPEGHDYPKSRSRRCAARTKCIRSRP